MTPTVTPTVAATIPARAYRRHVHRILLVPSPLLGPATWAPVASWLRDQGRDCAVAAPAPERRTPAEVLAAVMVAAGDDPVVLVPHSNAGLYAPHLGDLLVVRATVYVDAALPVDVSDGTTALAPTRFLDFLAGLADDDAMLPPWTQWWDEVDDLFPDAAVRARVEAEQPRMPLGYFTERLPVPDDWAQRPSAYLAFGDTYADEVAFARAHAWPVTEMPGAHLHPLHSPDVVATEILLLAGLLTP